MKVFILSSLLCLLSMSQSALADSQNLDRKSLVERIINEHGLTESQGKAVNAVFAKSKFMGQGNPEVTQHPMSRTECRAKRKAAGSVDRNASFEKICGKPFMAPLYDVKTQKPEDAKVCIDQYEYPGIPCEYPVVWVRANEAADLCHAMGKRLCDAHEWEGSCQGTLTGPDYDFAAAVGKSESAAVAAMRSLHNRNVSGSKRWSYGAKFEKGVCAQNSFKHEQCNGGNWKTCGSNTYPAGSFPGCTSPLQVYDVNGNAAEHMNLPLAADQMAKQGGKYGVTEMKGSWFIWDKFQAHEDWCRWRAPFWHGSRVLSDHSHHNYHLGFRCCAETGQQ